MMVGSDALPDEPDEQPSRSERRSDPVFAGSVINSLYLDDEVRRQFLSILADSIEHAHAANPHGWAVTLHWDPGARVRLNVDGIETCVLLRDRLYLVVDSVAITAKAQAVVVALHEQYGSPSDRFYSSFPTARKFWIEPTGIPESVEMARNAHFRLIALASQTVRTKGNFHHTHSPGVLAHLRQALGRDIPDPAYAGPSSEETRVWLFQANPKYYDLVQELNALGAGGEDWWAVSSSHTEMRDGVAPVWWTGRA